ncbi:MAG: hypothetical protein JSR65_10835 [Proteobacteria bacterium]|nr:hypothetical protein [Pseudomonadota bacterium]
MNAHIGHDTARKGHLQGRQNLARWRRLNGFHFIPRIINDGRFRCGVEQCEDSRVQSMLWFIRHPSASWDPVLRPTRIKAGFQLALE